MFYIKEHHVYKPKDTYTYPREKDYINGNYHYLVSKNKIYVYKIDTLQYLVKIKANNKYHIIRIIYENEEYDTSILYKVTSKITIIACNKYGIKYIVCQHSGNIHFNVLIGNKLTLIDNYIYNNITKECKHINDIIRTNLDLDTPSLSLVGYNIILLYEFTGGYESHCVVVNYYNDKRYERIKYQTQSCAIQNDKIYLCYYIFNEKKSITDIVDQNMQVKTIEKEQYPFAIDVGVYKKILDCDFRNIKFIERYGDRVLLANYKEIVLYKPARTLIDYYQLTRVIKHSNITYIIINILLCHKYNESFNELPQEMLELILIELLKLIILSHNQ